MAQAKMRNEIQNSREAVTLGALPSRGLDLGPFRRALAIAASGLTLAEGQARIEREDERIRATRRRSRLERRRAVALREGEDLPALSAADQRALAKADAVQAAAAMVQPVKGKPATAAVSTPICIRADVARGLRDRQRQVQEALRLGQTVALDAAREAMDPAEVVTVRRGESQKRIRTRDGLKLMHERGGLTPVGADGRARDDAAARMEADRLLAAGLRYRDLYELAAASVKSGLNLDGGRRTPGTIWAQAKAAQRRAALANQVRRLDMAVSAALGPEALYAVRMVAGEARSVRSLRPSRRPRQRLEAALLRALGVVSQCLGNGA